MFISEKTLEAMIKKAVKSAVDDVLEPAVTKAVAEAVGPAVDKTVAAAMVDKGLGGVSSDRDDEPQSLGRKKLWSGRAARRAEREAERERAAQAMREANKPQRRTRGYGAAPRKITLNPL